MKNTKLNKIINQLIKEVLAEDFPDIEAKNYPEALANQMGMEDLDIIYDNLIDEYDEKEAIAQLANLLYNNMGNQDDIIEAVEKSKLNELDSVKDYDPRKIFLGIQEKEVWGNNYKIRLTSKKTGKKIDINLNLDFKGVRKEKNN